VEQALRKQPNAVHLHKHVRVAERCDHQASLITVDRDVMRQAVGFSVSSLGQQREDRALPDEVRGGVVLVLVGEDGRELLA